MGALGLELRGDGGRGEEGAEGARGEDGLRGEDELLGLGFDRGLFDPLREVVVGLLFGRAPRDVLVFLIALTS